MRGEYPVCGMSGDRSVGSSPHAWGILCGNGAREAQRRFIPTCVGNTRCGRTCRDPWPVHPHMRGEYVILALYGLISAGSSPHAWGIPVFNAGRLPGFRFIPTCVGNTCVLTRDPGTASVHPHMRGEYSSLSRGMTPSTGSSPHAWGIRIIKTFVFFGIRFIPTCVGNTFSAWTV